MLDTHRSNRRPDFPFQTTLPTADISLDLPDSLEILEQLYLFLNRQKLANGFKKSYINFAAQLSTIVSGPVLSFISDDDEFDFVCTAQEGIVQRVKCRCTDLIIAHDRQSTTVTPLLPEFEDDAEFLTDTSELEGSVPGLNVAPRTTPWNPQLHLIASEEVRRFTGHSSAILGLGSFDPPTDEAEWELITER
jgi:hypothetical protein